MKPIRNPRPTAHAVRVGFTLIELLVVIAYDGPYGWQKNFPQHTTGGTNGINNSYVYMLVPEIEKSTNLVQLNLGAVSSDFFMLGMGDVCHRTGYNVAYGDGRAA